MKKITFILPTMVLAAIFCIVSPAYAQENENSLIVKLSPDTTIEKFLVDNGLTADQIIVGRDNYLLVKDKNQITVDVNDQFVGRYDQLDVVGADYVENNGTYEPFLVPNDPYYSVQQWNLQNVGAPYAWDDTTGRSDIVVAVLDTGFFTGQEDMQNIVWNNTGEIDGNGIDDDGNGYIDDIHGFNFVVSGNDLKDNYNHGTSVSSIIAASTDNNLGIAGLNWQSSIMPVKVCEVGYACPYFSIAQGIYYAVDNGAKVINMSLGGYWDSSYVRQAVQYAASKGVLMSVASGNNGSSVSYPAAYPETIAVGAVDATDNLAYFSNYGPELDLVAPGVAVFGAQNTANSYTYLYGTSFSAPHVAGAAALLLSYASDMSASQIRSYLNYSADKVSGMGGANFTEQYGFGRLNIGQAISTVKKDRGILSIEGLHEAERMKHQIGQVIDQPWASSGQVVQALASEGPGYVQYGPYVGDKISGKNYLARFNLSSSDNFNPDVIARIEVTNHNHPNEWKFLDIRGTDFAYPGSYQDFYLKFSKNQTGNLEYRVYSYGLADIAIDVTEVTPLNRDFNLDYQSEDLYRQVGKVVYDPSASEKFAVEVQNSEIGFAQYGPYANNLDGNLQHRAVFKIASSDNYTGSNLFRLEVINHQHPEFSVERIIATNDFSNTYIFENFGLNFRCQTGDTLEYRVFALGNSAKNYFSIDGVKIESTDNSWFRTYEAEEMPSQTGKVATDQYSSGGKIRQASASEHSSGYLVYGPYDTTIVPNQNYYAIFSIKSGNNTSANPLFRLEIYNPGGTTPFVQKNITGQMIGNTDTWQDFTLHYRQQSGGSMEFRVYTYDIADVAIDRITIITKDNDYAFYEAEDMSIGRGRVYADSYNNMIYVKATPTQGAGHIIYGPYTADQAPGTYEVTFMIKNEGSAKGNLVRIEAANSGGTGAYVTRTLTAGDFDDSYFTSQSLTFDRTSTGVMEYRVYTYGKTTVSVDGVVVRKL